MGFNKYKPVFKGFNILATLIGGFNKFDTNLRGSIEYMK